MPPENARCSPFVGRSRSNTSGSVCTAGSRPAAPSIAMTTVSGAMSRSPEPHGLVRRPRRELDRRVEPQALLDGVARAAGVGGEPRPGLAGVGHRGDGVGEQRARRLEPGEQQQRREADGLVGVDVLAREVAEEVVGGVVAPALEQAAEQARAVRRRRASRRCSARSDRTPPSPAPTAWPHRANAPASDVGHAQDLGDHRRPAAASRRRRRGRSARARRPRRPAVRPARRPAARRRRPAPA